MILSPKSWTYGKSDEIKNQFINGNGRSQDGLTAKIIFIGMEMKYYLKNFYFVKLTEPWLIVNQWTTIIIIYDVTKIPSYHAHVCR